MQSITEHERKLAATLGSLVDEPAADDDKPPRLKRWRFVLLIGVLTMAVTAIVIYQLEAVRWFDNSVSAEQARAQHSERIDEGIEEIDEPINEPINERINERINEQFEERFDVQVDEQTGAPHAVASAREVAGSGTIVASRATAVFSQFAGRIIGVSVDVGDSVEAGQVLVMLDDPGARFALEQATSDKAAADLSLAARAIELEQARLSLKRNEALAAREATSRQQLEDARMRAELAANALAQAGQALAGAELSVRIAEEAVHELTVRAPFSGTITRLNAQVGDTVLARVDSVRESQSLLTLTDMTSLVIDADVAETNVAPLNAGARGQAVLDAYPDQPFDIEVLRLAPIASVEKGTITLRLTISAPPGGTRPNMAARIRIPVHDVPVLDVPELDVPVHNVPVHNVPEHNVPEHDVPEQNAGETKQ